MKNWLLILPVALLVAYSQVVVKWWTLNNSGVEKVDTVRALLAFVTDPMVISAYGAGLIGSFAWLVVLTRLPLSIAFPVYIGVTFILVVIGGSVFLAEAITPPKVCAILLILTGIAIGAKG